MLGAVPKTWDAQYPSCSPPVLISQWLFPFINTLYCQEGHRHELAIGRMQAEGSVLASCRRRHYFVILSKVPLSIQVQLLGEFCILIPVLGNCQWFMCCNPVHLLGKRFIKAKLNLNASFLLCFLRVNKHRNQESTGRVDVTTSICIYIAGQNSGTTSQAAVSLLRNQQNSHLLQVFRHKRCNDNNKCTINDQ